MKKIKEKNNIFIFIFLIIFIVLIILIVFLFIKKIDLNILNREIYNHNIEFNKFDRDLKGTEIISLINLCIDNNKREEDKNSTDFVKIEIVTEDEKVITMESIINSNLEEFNTYLGDQNFKLIEKDYHLNGKISFFKYELLPIKSINNIEEKLTI